VAAHDDAMAELPEGTVTFLFSDVEGSARLLERHGSAMGEALAIHHRLFEEIVERHEGAVFETIGDAVYAAFSRPADAVAAALGVQRALATTDWGAIGRLAVRIAVHTGQVERRGEHYFGNALFRAARLQAIGYGEQTLLSGITATLVADALPDGASLRDLGSHRLKDLGRPERIHQLVHRSLRDAFPALKSLDAHPHNLPLQLSSFVGRERELAGVGELLDEHRLVTLRGPGGIGKTRLALQVAAERLERHQHGAWFVDLGALSDPEFVPSAIATSLGLRELSGEPLARTLAEHLATRQALLILDNMEQLLPAAGMSVTDLLAAAPELRVLVTSRVPLRVRGEQEYAVQGLSSGDPARKDSEAPPAATLFLERARGIGQDIEVDDESGPLIAEICTRCDGLPLAIELAAARLRVFSLRQLRDRLAERLELLAGGAHDLPARHRTLRSAVAWSVDLLPEAARRLFAQLGIFVGGFSLEAVEAVAITDSQSKTHELLDELLVHSLIRRLDGGGGDGGEEPRFAMLETIREFAAERLAELEEGELIRERHAQWLADLFQRSLAQWPRPDHDAFTRLASDLDNLRAALARPIPADMRLALVANVWLLWEALGLLREGLG
jgi:predicted ATPase/class 3 adenylate cyclase